MKNCPTCHRTYPDDTLAFCLIDGSVLSAPYDPQTKPMSQPRSHEPPPTEIMQQRPHDPPPTQIIHPPANRPETTPSPAAQPTMQTAPPYGTGQTNQTAAKSKTPWIVAGIAVFLVVFGGFAMLLAAGAWMSSRRSSSETKPGTRSQTVSNPSTSPDPGTTLPESSPSPTKLDVSGRWVGLSDDTPATMVINSSDDDSYDGTETISGKTEVKISVDVEVDPETRHITITETSILNGMGGWTLGVNDGSISSDGSKMSGSAKDIKGKTYSWSFSRQ